MTHPTAPKCPCVQALEKAREALESIRDEQVVGREHSPGAEIFRPKLLVTAMKDTAVEALAAITGPAACGMAQMRADLTVSQSELHRYRNKWLKSEEMNKKLRDALERVADGRLAPHLYAKFMADTLAPDALTTQQPPQPAGEQAQAEAGERVGDLEDLSLELAVYERFAEKFGDLSCCYDAEDVTAVIDRKFEELQDQLSTERENGFREGIEAASKWLRQCELRVSHVFHTEAYSGDKLADAMERALLKRPGTEEGK